MNKWRREVCEGIFNFVYLLFFLIFFVFISRVVGHVSMESLAADAPPGPPKVLSLASDVTLQQALNDSALDVVSDESSSSINDVVTCSPAEESSMVIDGQSLDDFLADFDLNDAAFQELLE